MGRIRILTVDDEPGMLEVLADTLRKLPETDVVAESRGENAARMLESGGYDVLITDIRMPGMDGVELTRLARQRDPDLLILLLTAFPTVETAVEGMKLGASDYIVKPFLPEDLLATVRRLIETKRLRQENVLLHRHIEKSYSFDEMLGQSELMRGVFETIQRLAPSDVDVLITGETGTGKDLVARSVHRRSRRADGRFVPVDCGAIPEHLLESEFFGYERGAFTGAQARSLGLLELAHGGTFFLDEIAELPAPLQAKLLRVLQERRFRRVGGKEEIAVDARVVAATSRDLSEEVRQHRFREDLFYRIDVGRIELPPLRSREGDVPLLIRHFIDRYAREMGKPGLRVEGDTLEVLSSYPWPGNVRELQNTLKRMAAMAKGPEIPLLDIPDEIVVRAGDRPGKPLKGFFFLREQRTLAFEKEYLTHLLTVCKGDMSEAAREAHIPRPTLYRLLARHGLKPTDFRA